MQPSMHILVTDSGVGGLSVCAYAERFVREHGFAQPVRLTFANAAPANDAGYNAMPTREAKIETFDRFLRNVTQRFAPDMIYVACNTLSVLLPDTPQARLAGVPVKGIVEGGSELLARELLSDAQGVAMIFGTQTTIDAGAYPRLLVEHGIDPRRIVSQACPGLADVISEDREGLRAAEQIGRWVRAAAARHPPGPADAIAYLACTHYGYRSELFAAAFAEIGMRAKVLNPNESAVHDVFGPQAACGEGARPQRVEMQVVSRYRIPDATQEALAWYLGAISPCTVQALHHFVHSPDLF